MTVRACHKRIRSPSSPSSPNRSSSPSHPPRNSRLQLTAAVLREASPMPETGLVPTYLGHVGSTKDALIIIEACLSGYLNHLGRRPRSSEEWTLSQSGNIFVYETRSSGITTWRDGIPWSEPIKVGNFELRRQLASPASRSSSSSGSNGHSRANGTYSNSGLCRRTLSVTIRGVTHHLVAYFNIHDLAANALISPSLDPLLAGVMPRPELVSQGYQTPVEQDDLYDILSLMGS